LPPVASPPIRVILLLAEVRDDLLQDALELALSSLDQTEAFAETLVFEFDNVCQTLHSAVDRREVTQHFAFGFHGLEAGLGFGAHLEALEGMRP
jgi:hypothetical protein